MRRITLPLGLFAVTAALALPAAAGAARMQPARVAAPPASAAAAASHECQHPVGTGVEIAKLENVTVAAACPVALDLYAWENQDRHANQLYGCHRPAGGAPGVPYLRMTTFEGWHLSLHGPYHYGFQMSRGRQSFYVGGTDFPVNCT